MRGEQRDVDETMARVRAVTVGEVEHRPVVLAEPDPSWPDRYEREAARIREALGERVVELHPATTRDVNLHVFGPGCEEVARMLAFRDHLRRDAADRDRYAMTKRELASRDWPTVQHYSDAETEVVAAITARALSAAEERP